MNPSPERPWTRLYRDDITDPPALTYPSVTAMFAAAADRAPDRTAIQYFDAALSYARVQQLADGLARHLRSRGLVQGDRVALYLQSSPHFVISALAVWRAGGVVVPVNPMYRTRELAGILHDSGARALISSEQGYREYGRDAVPGTGAQIVVTTSELDFQQRHDPRVFGALTPSPFAGVDDLVAVCENSGGAVELSAPAPDDLAVLCYTSGTSGPPKGAMLTHRSLVLEASAVTEWAGLADGARLFAMAPLFHVTGFAVEMIHSIALAGTLILPYRFSPAVALELFAEFRPEFTVGPPTAYTAFLSDPAATRDHFLSFRALFAGGAPLPAAVVDQFEERFGRYIVNGYGLTETSAACVLMPLGSRAAVEPRTSALANGVPLPGVDLRVVGDDGRPVPIGECGEVIISGDYVTSGYWGKPEETANAIVDGWLHTGDIGMFDENDLLYIVDRKKDMIITSGFKVWPGEVEQVLYAHPAVSEAAVVGRRDDYRGETVQAFVAVKTGMATTAEELIAWCRERMAAYKYPRVITVVDTLPKTASGKILRRAVR